MTADIGSPSAGRRALDVVAVAVVMACLAGFLSALVSWFRREVLHDHLRTFMSPDLVWMSPIGHLLWFIPVIVILTAATLLLARFVTLRVVTMVFGFLGMLSILLLYSPRLHQYAALVLAIGVAVRFAVIVGSNEFVWRRRFDRLARGGVVLVAASAALTVGTSALRERMAIAALPDAAAGSPNILLLILDTVRARSLSLYGYSRPTTPLLEELAREGTTFEWAFATASWTLPSHASMFTGHYPSQQSADFTMSLDSRYPVLAEVMAARGYRTGGFTANLLATTRGFGLQRGFSRYEDFRLTIRQLLFSTTLGQGMSIRRAETALLKERWLGGAVRAFFPPELEGMNITPSSDPKSAAHVISSFLDWRRQDSTRPYFAFLNLFDAHHPYVAPPSYKTLFADQTLVGRYDRSIRYLDDQLRILSDTLRARGELDRTIVVITSDHGEQLGERGMQGHANSLYEQVVHVPLLIRYPPRVPAGMRIGRQVSLRDLAATITDLASARGETGLGGTSLAGAWTAGGAPASAALQELSRVPLPSPSHRNAKGNMYALSDDSLHIIHSGDGRIEIFAYRTDPAEEHDLSAGPLRALVSPFETARTRILGAGPVAGVRR